MVTNKIFIGAACCLSLLSCTSTKKFHALQANYTADEKKWSDSLLKTTAYRQELERQNEELREQVKYFKRNSTQLLKTLEDLSVVSGKQAESIKKSLENLSEKDVYIRSLQTAIERKDSLNMSLVMRLKGSLQGVRDEDINIKVEKGVVYIDISDKLLFNSGQYAVTSHAKVLLGKVAKVLNDFPDLDIMVEGHTDSVPIQTECMNDNWDLSTKRATSVIRILEKEYKIKPERMTAAGRGKFAPVAGNDSKQGRALNRRTRIIVLPQLDQLLKLLE